MLCVCVCSCVHVSVQAKFVPKSLASITASASLNINPMSTTQHTNIWCCCFFCSYTKLDEITVPSHPIRLFVRFLSGLLLFWGGHSYCL